MKMTEKAVQNSSVYLVCNVDYTGANWELTLDLGEIYFLLGKDKADDCMKTYQGLEAKQNLIDIWIW